MNTVGISASRVIHSFTKTDLSVCSGLIESHSIIQLVKHLHAVTLETTSDVESVTFSHKKALCWILSNFSKIVLAAVLYIKQP